MGFESYKFKQKLQYHQSDMAIAQRKTKSKNTKVTKVEQNTISSVHHSELKQYIERKQQKQQKPLQNHVMSTWTKTNNGQPFGWNKQELNNNSTTQIKENCIALQSNNSLRKKATKDV